MNDMDQIFSKNMEKKGNGLQLKADRYINSIARRQVFQKE
jgi:hypothetical protein